MTESTAPATVTLRLRRAEESLRVALQPTLTEAGIGMDHWRILAHLEDAPGATMSVVAEGAVVPAPSLTRYVDHLVSLGLAQRHVDPADRRRAVLSLTARGTALVQRLVQVERAAAPAWLQSTPSRAQAG